MALAHGEVAHLLNPNYKEDVRRWLAEDCPSFDYGGFVVGEAVTEAKLLGKSPVSRGVFQLRVFRQSSAISPDFEPLDMEDYASICFGKLALLQRV